MQEKLASMIRIWRPEPDQICTQLTAVLDKARNAPSGGPIVGADRVFKQQLPHRHIPAFEHEGTSAVHHYSRDLANSPEMSHPAIRIHGKEIDGRIGIAEH